MAAHDTLARKPENIEIDIPGNQKPNQRLRYALKKNGKCLRWSRVRLAGIVPLTHLSLYLLSLPPLRRPFLAINKVTLFDLVLLQIIWTILVLAAATRIQTSVDLGWAAGVLELLVPSHASSEPLWVSLGTITTNIATDIHLGFAGRGRRRR